MGVPKSNELTYEQEFTRTMVRAARVLNDLFEERVRQYDKWGEQTWPPHPACTCGSQARNLYQRIVEDKARAGTVTWCDIFMEEWFEALAEPRIREELVQAAAVIVAAIESGDKHGVDGSK